MVMDARISRINKNILEDGWQAKNRVMESYFTLMEAIIRAIFRITK
jgi:hypothetical protein